jgi:hypothetical protein
VLGGGLTRVLGPTVARAGNRFDELTEDSIVEWALHFG